jgi:hypothetical protein
MEAREQLRLLSLEMELQRAWLAAWLDDREVQAARRRNSALWRAAMSLVRARSVWVAAAGVVLEWWRKRKARPSR